MRQKTTSRLSKLIKSKKAKVGIVGMGYVGSALSAAVEKGGFSILGFEIDPEKVAKINALQKKNFQATDTIERIKECDILAICVPTPVDEYNRPNFSILTKAASDISHN
ncbi:MAG TPA: NAD(P)-dependent oxidoreductase, partial [Patescibacteria group bacterium]|nr:NAD(P)-dependent oxidoreductase [Patescibacteria group bacterium]